MTNARVICIQFYNSIKMNNIESKPVDKKPIPGKPYPEDYETTVQKVRGFIEERDALKAQKPSIVIVIFAIIIGGALLGLLLSLAYHDARITVMAVALGGFLGYALIQSMSRRSIQRQVLQMYVSRPEGVFLSALELWQRGENKRSLEEYRAEEKAYKDNPWIILEEGLFPEDPLSEKPIKATIEPVLDDTNEIVDYRFHASPTGATWDYPIWHQKNNVHPISPSFIKTMIEWKGNGVDMSRAEYIIACRKNDGIKITFFKWDTEVLTKSQD